MSHQGEDGWYPECDVCDCGNLGGSITICHGCLKKMGYNDFLQLKRDAFRDNGD